MCMAAQPKNATAHRTIHTSHRGIANEDVREYYTTKNKRAKSFHVFARKFVRRLHPLDLHAR